MLVAGVVLDCLLEELYGLIDEAHFYIEGPAVDNHCDLLSG
jgi:hypothetical protein